MSDLHCQLCPHHCIIPEGQTGFCGNRMNESGENISRYRNIISSMAMDPIEKKPLYHYYPGRKILSVGSFGCNMHCIFCQNHRISMPGQAHPYRFITPEELAEKVLSIPDNLGIAFTYNEPLLSYEYIMETSVRVRPYGKKVVLVTNGCFTEPEKILPYVDAMNIDLKGPASFYRELQGDYDTVHAFIAKCIGVCHAEVTTLVVPGKSDDEEWIREEASWLASLDPDTVYHLSRYFPAYHSYLPATDPEKLYRLRDIAAGFLKNVYVGNV